MIKRNYSALVLSIFFASAIAAQEPQRFEADTVLKNITLIPSTLEELHTVFTVDTKYGMRLRLAELTDPVYEQVKSLVSAIHEKTILEIMERSPRKDMSYAIQYEDERWKLALRPVLGVTTRAKLLKIDASVKTKVIQIFEMQNVFDWLAYYKEDGDLKRKYREKEGSIAVENGVQNARAKWNLQKSHFEEKQRLWTNRYNKYSKAFILLQQLLYEINFGAGLNAEEKKILIPVLADVQARALEAIEKLVWNEMSIVSFGEMIFQEDLILKMYSK